MCISKKCKHARDIITQTFSKVTFSIQEFLEYFCKYNGKTVDGLMLWPKNKKKKDIKTIQFCGFRDMGQGEKCQLLWCFYDLRFDSISLLFFDSYLMKFWILLVLEFENREQQCKCGQCPPNSAIVQTLSINFHLERNKFSS